MRYVLASVGKQEIWGLWGSRNMLDIDRSHRKQIVRYLQRFFVSKTKECANFLSTCPCVILRKRKTEKIQTCNPFLFKMHASPSHNTCQARSKLGPKNSVSEARLIFHNGVDTRTRKCVSPSRETMSSNSKRPQHGVTSREKCQSRGARILPGYGYTSLPTPRRCHIGRKRMWHWSRKFACSVLSTILTMHACSKVIIWCRGLPLLYRGNVTGIEYSAWAWGFGTYDVYVHSRASSSRIVTRCRIHSVPKGMKRHEETSKEMKWKTKNQSMEQKVKARGNEIMKCDRTGR